MKNILTVLFIFLALFTIASPILADDEIRNLNVDLKAKGFTQTNWLDNLDSNLIIFAPNDKFQVQLTINNLGNRNQTNVRVFPAFPDNITVDTGYFVIPQIAANQSYIKNITITIKGSKFVNKALTKNTIRFDVNTDVGTKAGDFTSFFTSGGSKEVVAKTGSSSAQNLPATGANVFIGTGLALILGFVTLRLRKAIRGY